jgi:hypothetical protein
MRMQKIFLVVLMTAAAASNLSGAPQTWTGTISDNMCGAKHNMAGMDDRECVEMCVKHEGKYIFVSGGKIFKIANQDNKDLALHAAHMVRLTGEMKDNTITVTKIEMPKSTKH